MFVQTRGHWGEQLVRLMRERFDVDVVHVSDISSEKQLSYEQGYNAATRTHLATLFGDAVERTEAEVQHWRLQQYNRWRDTQC